MRKGVHIIRSIYQEPAEAPTYVYTSVETPLGVTSLQCDVEGRWFVVDEHGARFPAPSEAVQAVWKAQKMPRACTWPVRLAV